MAETKVKPLKTKAQLEDDRRRRRAGLKAIAGDLPRVASRAFGRRGLSEAGLAAHWAEIVGSELASVCLPRRLAFPNRTSRENGTLALRVAPGHALTLQHLEPMILARVNQHFGYAAVERLKLTQGPLALPRRPAPAPRPDPERAARLAERMAARTEGDGEGLGDERLDEAFRRLARALAVKRGEDAGW